MQIANLEGTKKLPRKFGVIRFGGIRNKEYVFNLGISRLDPSKFIVLERFEDGSYANLNPNFEFSDGGELTLTAPVGVGYVSKVHLLHVSDGITPARLDFDRDTYDLDRLLSVTEDDIVKNIRWTGKISDYETLLFSCAQSFDFQTNVDSKIHCLLPMAYQSLERDDPIWVEEAVRRAESIRDYVVLSDDLERKVSFLTMLWHLYAYKGDVRNFESALNGIVVYSGDISSHPKCAYNSVRGCLLSGCVEMLKGRTDDAISRFRQCNSLFHVAVPVFATEALNLYKELLSIYRCSYHAVIGINQLSGGRMRSTKPIDLSSVFDISCRLSNPASKKKLLAKVEKFYSGLSEAFRDVE